MATTEPRLLDVTIGAYDSLDEALVDFWAVRDLYQKLGASSKMDAAVVSKSPDGKVKIEKTFEASTRHDALAGLGFGLAAGLIAALFPAVGITAALVAGGIGGAAIGALVGHVQTGMKRDDLKKIGDALDKSQAGLVVVYETNLADQVKKTIKTVRQFVSKLADVSGEDIEKAIRQSRAA